MFGFVYKKGGWSGVILHSPSHSVPRRGFDMEFLGLRGDIAAEFVTAVLLIVMPLNVCIVIFLIGKVDTDNTFRVFAFQLRSDRFLKVKGPL